MIHGICCAYCKKFENKAKCPVQQASPWSRWSAFCSAYVPNPEIKEARPMLVISDCRGKPKRSWQAINSRDGNNVFDLEAKSLKTAALKALTALGWGLTETTEDE